MAGRENCVDLEHPLLRVPFERLRNVFKNSARGIEKDVSLAIASIHQLCGFKDPLASKASFSSQLDKLVQKLELLQKKVF